MDYFSRNSNDILSVLGDSFRFCLLPHRVPTDQTGGSRLDIRFTLDTCAKHASTDNHRCFETRKKFADKLGNFVSVISKASKNFSKRTKAKFLLPPHYSKEKDS